MRAQRDALAALLRETRAARMADRLPEERRPRGGLLISIGVPDEPEAVEPEADEDEIEDDDY